MLTHKAARSQACLEYPLLCSTSTVASVHTEILEYAPCSTHPSLQPGIQGSLHTRLLTGVYFLVLTNP